MVDSSDIQARAARGLALLLSRSIGLRLLAFASSILLTRLLTPADHGVFAIVTFFASAFYFVGDAGTSAALVQQADPPSPRELGSAFTGHLCLAVLFCIAAWLLAPAVVASYGLPASDVWLFRAGSLVLLPNALRAVPTVLLQRDLRFGRLVIPDLVETVVSNIVAVTLALLGAGAWALVGANLARTVAGTVTLLTLRPWTPALCWDWPVLKRLLRYGLPTQLTGLTLILRDSLSPVFLGLTLGPAAVGYIAWAGKLTALPLLFAETAWTVSLPLFSRLRDDPAAKASAARGIFRLASAFMVPCYALLVALGPAIVHAVYGDRWLPALPTLYWLALGLAISGPLSAALVGVIRARGVGGAVDALRVAAGNTAASWAVGLALTPVLGPAVAGAARAAGGAVESLLLLRLARQDVKLDVRFATAWLIPVLSCLPACAAARLIAGGDTPSVLRLAAALAGGALTYALLLVAVDADWRRRGFALARGGAALLKPPYRGYRRNQAGA